MKRKVSQTLLPTETIENQIYHIRSQKVMLDADLAELYGVPTKALNQAVKRNIHRFPSDFAFRLTSEEASVMRSRFVTASKRNIRYRPLAFTEHGALMLANVLNSHRAIQMSIFIVRTFIKLREALSHRKEIFRKLLELERRIGQHDVHIKAILDAILRLMAPEPESQEKPKPRIGFRTD